MAFDSSDRRSQASSLCPENKYEGFLIPHIPDATHIPPEILLDSIWSSNVCGQLSNSFADSGGPDPTLFSLYPDPFSLAQAPREQPLHCNHPGCIMKFDRSRDLKKHQRVHTSRHERQHPCPACDMKFIWPKDLKRHRLSRHSDGKDNNRGYFCPEGDCDYHRRGFQRKDKMVRHWRRIHEAPRLQTSCEQRHGSNDHSNLLLGSSNDLLSLSTPFFESGVSSFSGFQGFGSHYPFLSSEANHEGMADMHVESDNSVVGPVSSFLEPPWDLGHGTN